LRAWQVVQAVSTMAFGAWAKAVELRAIPIKKRDMFFMSVFYTMSWGLCDEDDEYLAGGSVSDSGLGAMVELSDAGNSADGGRQGGLIGTRSEDG